MTQEDAVKLFLEIAGLAFAARQLLSQAVADSDLDLTGAAEHVVQKIGFIADAACWFCGVPGHHGDAFDWLLSPVALQAFGRGGDE